MDQVAVLGVLHEEERTVGGEPAAQKSTLVDASDPNGFGRAVDLRRRCAVERHVNEEAVAGADSGRHDARRLSKPLAPAVRKTCQKRRARPSRERLHEPTAGFVAALVLEPQDPLAVECRRAVDHADNALGDLARGGVDAPVG
ncbi:MAG: hypothetical protein E6G39_03605 [Actinobacteria bacterium]|nr:MAG: hypothetical protein E6G39_03605 [Actinomycetota bacterium]